MTLSGRSAPWRGVCLALLLGDPRPRLWVASTVRAVPLAPRGML